MYKCVLNHTVLLVVESLFTFCPASEQLLYNHGCVWADYSVSGWLPSLLCRLY